MSNTGYALCRSQRGPTLWTSSTEIRASSGQRPACPTRPLASKAKANNSTGCGNKQQMLHKSLYLLCSADARASVHNNIKCPISSVFIAYDVLTHTHLLFAENPPQKQSLQHLDSKQVSAGTKGEEWFCTSCIFMATKTHIGFQSSFWHILPVISCMARPLHSVSMLSNGTAPYCRLGFWCHCLELVLVSSLQNKCCVSIV